MIKQLKFDKKYLILYNFLCYNLKGEICMGDFSEDIKVQDPGISNKPETDRSNRGIHYQKNILLQSEIKALKETMGGIRRESRKERNDFKEWYITYFSKKIRSHISRYIIFTS